MINKVGGTARQMTVSRRILIRKMAGQQGHEAETPGKGPEWHESRLNSLEKGFSLLARPGTKKQGHLGLPRLTCHSESR